MSIQVLEFESLDLVIDSLGIADALADFASSDQVLEIVLLLQVLKSGESLNLVVDTLGIADSFADFAGSDEVLEFVCLIQILEPFVTEIYLPEVLKIVILFQVLEEPSSLCLSSELTSSLQGNKVLELILI